MVLSDYFKLPARLFLLKDRINLAGFSIGLAFNLAIWLLLYLKIARAFGNESEWMETIPLHYNVYFGIDLIGSWQKVLIMPLIGSVIFILNGLLAYFLYVKEKLLSYFLVISSAFVQIVFLIAAFMVVVINIY